MIPPIYQFGLLCLIAYRAWRLIAEDEILEWPRRWLVRLPRDWEEGDPAKPNRLPDPYRDKLALFITCPWCAGAWVSLVTYVVWIAVLGDWPDTASEVFVGIGVWFAISCVVGLIRSKLDPPE